MRKLICSVLFLVSVVAFAQTEDDLVRYAGERKAMMEAGAISELDFYRDLHSKTASMPPSYRFKAENLRWIGERIDILEAAESGKISQEKARRLIVEQAANSDEADLRRKQAAVEAERAYAERQAAQAEAQRRALALQLLQNQPRMAIQPIQPYQMQTRPRTTCQSMRNGDQVTTTCQ